MIAFIEKYFKELTGALLLLLVGIGVTSFVQEHDARLKAEQTLKESANVVTGLKAQVDAVDKAGKVQIAKLQKQATTVKTPAQAIQAIPDLSALPLNVRPAPGLPNAVIVDTLPLFEDLNKCKQDAVNLGVCSTKLDLEQKIDAQKDIQITALKHKPEFWHRVKVTAITVGVGIGIGYAAHR